MQLMKRELSIAKDILSGDAWGLACEIYLEDWENLLFCYGRDTLMKVRDHYALQEQYETCSEIQKYL